ncbi:MAG: ABC transporter substrate-binding protein [Deltaproteobacteria bacterium]|nr:ABC transporter substrate-binding protein [Candidatus Tharpella aukensis]
MRKATLNNWFWLLFSSLLMVSVLFLSPVNALAQIHKNRVHRVAVIAFAPPFLKSYEGLRAGLESRGYNLDNDLFFDVHCLGRDTSKVEPLMAKLAAADYDLIFSITTPVTRAIHASLLAGKFSMPVVFTTVADPLGSKIVNNLRHPGGNFTGVSHLSIELLPQRLLLFKKAFPAMRRVALFFDPDVEISKRSLDQGFLRQAAVDIGIELVVVHVRNRDEMIKSCQNFSAEQADAIFMLPDPLSVAHFNELLELSHRLKIPLMVVDNMLLQRGGVMGYSPDFYGVGFQAATIVDQIFKGGAPGDIPVQNAEKVNLVVSLKEVQGLGLEISDDILRQADEVLR